MHFHRLCHRAHEVLGLTLQVPAGRAAEQRFWNEDVLEVLLTAQAEGKLPRYDAVIVDEAQDFAQGWWDYVEEMLAGEGTGRLVLLYDPRQNIFGRRDEAVPDLPTLVLDQAFRSTQALCRACAGLVGAEIEPAIGAPEGKPPHLERQANGTAALNQLRDRLESLRKDGVRPEQIAILTPHRKANSILAGVESIAGVELVDAPGKQGAVAHSTIAGFKGLEADVVILVDLVPGDERCGPRYLYAAGTRAKHRLYMYQFGDVWRVREVAEA